MRVTFKREGGIAFFPGLNTSATIDGDQLPPDQAAQLDQLMRAACFFDQPMEVGTPADGAADYMHYLITADDGAQQHSVQVMEPIQDSHMHALVVFLQAAVRAAPPAAAPPKRPRRKQR